MRKFKNKAFKAFGVLMAAVCIGTSASVLATAQESTALSVRLEGVVEEAYRGEKIEIATAYARFPENVENITYVVISPSGKVVELVEGTFVVEEEGDYGVYIGVDGVNGDSKTTSYTVSASTANFPIMTTAPVVPVAVFSGMPYSVPAAVFTDYNPASPETTDYEVYYVDERAQETKVDGSFTPMSTVSGSPVSLIYRSTASTGGRNEVEYEIPVLNACSTNSFGATAYDYKEVFLKTNVENAEVTKEGTIFYGSSDFSLTFANYINANFTLDLNSIAGKANFEKLRLTLTDSANGTQTNVIEISAKGETTSYVTVNGGTSVVATGSVLDVQNGISLSFDNETKTLTDGGGKDIAVLNQTARSKDFFGYASDKVSLKLEAVGVQSSSALRVDGINGHAFTTSTAIVDGQIVEVGVSPDFISPDLVLDEELETTVNAGDKLVIPSAIGIDVLDVAPAVTVSVFYNDMPVTADDGTMMLNVSADKAYVLTPNSMGNYYVNYTATDASDNPFMKSQEVRVKDGVAPTIDVKSNPELEVKVGTEIAIPEFTYSDNVTATENLKAFVTVNLPYHTYRIVKAGDTFKFEQKGNYYIRYTVYDEFYNMANVEIKVVCK